MANILASLGFLVKQHAAAIFPTEQPLRTLLSSELYCRRVYAHKWIVEIVEDGRRRPCPLDWLDSFCMRNFTGEPEFDDTLPVAEGFLEAGLRVSPVRLAAAMSAWLTKRGKGNGRPVQVEIRPAPPASGGSPG
jgi:hypothetical protein